MATYAESSGAVKVTINGDAIHTTDTYVPLTINGSGFPEIFYSGVLSDAGNDIYVTDLDGNIWQHDLIHLNKVNNECIVRVRAPSVTSGAALQFMVQYGGLGTNITSADWVGTYENVFGGVADFQVMHDFQGSLTDRTANSHSFQCIDGGPLLAVDPSYEDTPAGSGFTKTLPGYFSPFRAYYLKGSAVKQFTNGDPFTAYVLRRGNWEAISTTKSYNESDLRAVHFNQSYFYLGQALGAAASRVQISGGQFYTKDWHGYGYTWDGTTANAAGMNVYIDGGEVVTYNYLNNAFDLGPTMAETIGVQLYKTTTNRTGCISEFWIIDKELSKEALRTYHYVNTSGAEFITSEYIDPANPTGAIDYPVVTVHPTGWVAYSGDTVSFSVSATNATSYQWRKDGSEITGGTSAVLTLTGVTDANEGEYNVRVRNLYGSVYSNFAFLTVLDADYYDEDETVDQLSGVYHRFYESSTSNIITSGAAYTSDQNLGNLYYKDAETFSFKIGNISDEDKNFSIYTDSVNANIKSNLTYSLDRNTFSTTLSGIYIKPHQTKLIWGKYTVEDVPLLSSGTLLIKAREE